MVAIDEDRILGFFEQEVRRSGHSLESRVENTLRQRGFDVHRESPYLDKDESKGRYVDLRAHGFIPSLDKFNQKEKHVVGQFMFIIECKNLPDHGWVFSKSLDPGLNIPDKISFADNMPTSVLGSDPTWRYVPRTSFPDLFYASSYAEYIRANSCHSTANPKSNKRLDNLYDAINKVIKATRFQLDFMTTNLRNLLKLVSDSERIVAFVIVQPLIVFQGHMYGSKLDGEDVKLHRISYAQLPKRYTSSLYNEIQGMIHIVSYDALGKYLELVENHYWAFASKIITEQSSLVSTMNEITKYFQNT